MSGENSNFNKKWIKLHQNLGFWAFFEIKTRSYFSFFDNFLKKNLISIPWCTND